MNHSALLSIGKKVREIRTGKKIKLIEVAEKAGISKGLLSQVENGRTIPSLPVLLQIIKVLGVDYSVFFEGIDDPTNSPYILKKKEDYTPFEKEDAIGFNYFSVFSQSVNNMAIQVNILELTPRAKREKVVTNGYTYLYILEGEIEYLLDEQSMELCEGDSLFFNGQIPHVPKNNSNSNAKILVIYMLSPDKN